MATASKLIPTIIVYKIGEDLTQEHYDKVVVALASWFEKVRSTKEPVAAAKHVLDCCMRGVKASDGQPWQTAATATLATRLKMAAQFDLELLKGIMTANIEKKQKRERDKLSKERRKLETQNDTGYGKEFTDLQKASYGDSPLMFFTTAELKHREKLRKGYLQQFPQLDNIAAEGKLNLMLDLMLLVDRLRFRNADTRKGAVKATENEIQSLTKQLVDLEKAMGIHPEQLAKLQKDSQGGSIGEAVKRMDEMGGAKQLRELAFAEELILAWQACQMPSPRTNTGGYQVDEVALWGMTQCRTCECPKCGQRNVAGFSVEEIEAWLVAQGNNTPVDTLIDADA